MKPLGANAPVVAWVIYSELISIMGISLLLALVYRMAALRNKSHLLTTPKAIIAMGVFEVFYPIPAIYTGLALHPSEEESLAFIDENYPKMKNFYLTHSCTLFATTTDKVMPYFCVAIGQILLLSVGYTAVGIATIRGLKAVKIKRSEKTYRLQRSLAVSLFFQFALPGVMIVFSILSFAISGVLHLESAQVICQIAFLFATLHTTANGVIVMLLVRPYREFLFNLIPILRTWQKRKLHSNKEQVTSLTVRVKAAQSRTSFFQA
ncbi:serpentine type 7TM GPCR chemoreceptor srh domain-containing protein [Ditylenchus destructor]|uniref:Serpentine type 7TM GPCR chemoreceptor srh domain-containing protein n=1 Tax=Ditylenchus destructor TaxID=166010 RepID=A0AAD4QVF6_9BILA|nr:serpentine type 7TM GPCR chemoreceptor srh domain-containing protein [Ditylenchus destructor]